MPIVAFIAALAALILFTIETVRTKSLVAAGLTCIALAYIVASVHHGGHLITW